VFACHVVTVCRKLKSASLVVISGFRHGADELCVLLGSYAHWIGNSVPAFGDNLSIPSSRVRLPKKNLNYLTSVDGTDRLHLNVGTDLYQYMLRKIPEEHSRFRESVPAEMKLAITLRYLATGDSFMSLMYLCKASKQFISSMLPGGSESCN
jgi:hypothetical protein